MRAHPTHTHEHTHAHVQTDVHARIYIAINSPLYIRDLYLVCVRRRDCAHTRTVATLVGRSMHTHQHGRICSERKRGRLRLISNSTGGGGGGSRGGGVLPFRSSERIERSRNRCLVLLKIIQICVSKYHTRCIRARTHRILKGLVPKIQFGSMPQNAIYISTKIREHNSFATQTRTRVRTYG